MFNFIKSYIEDYKTYKIEKAQDDLMLEESLAKHRADMEHHGQIKMSFDGEDK